MRMPHEMRMCQIARDPFARQTLVRMTIRPPAAGQTCSWCGGIRTTRCHHPYLYRYGTEPDAMYARVSWHSGLFCSKGCHDSYHA
jgi:hypothetical protein